MVGISFPYGDDLVGSEADLAHWRGRGAILPPGHAPRKPQHDGWTVQPERVLGMLGMIETGAGPLTGGAVMDIGWEVGIG